MVFVLWGFYFFFIYKPSILGYPIYGNPHIIVTISIVHHNVVINHNINQPFPSSHTTLPRFALPASFSCVCTIASSLASEEDWSRILGHRLLERSTGAFKLNKPTVPRTDGSTYWYHSFIATWFLRPSNVKKNLGESLFVDEKSLLARPPFF